MICELLDFCDYVAVTYFPSALNDWTSHLLWLCNLRVHCVDLDKGKGVPNKSWRLREGMECWDSSLTLTSSTTGTAELSAPRPVLTLPPGKFLGSHFRYWVNGPQGYWIRTEEVGHLTMFQRPLTYCATAHPHEFLYAFCITMAILEVLVCSFY
jgi:hypothetical protein